jgi:signal transduction histidine kinase
VRDDGKGIPKGMVDRDQRLGLLGLRERAAQLGGDVTVRSRRDRGTAVTARVPLPLS